MSLETEVKIYLPNLDEISAKLERLGAHLKKARLFERNIRYENADESLTGREIVLRLRQDDRARLTYKEPTAARESLNTRTRIELETEVADFTTMYAILQKLGFHEHMIYEKYRTTYEMDGAEIVLDEMPFANFIEIEGAPAAIESTITRLDLAYSGRILVSYVELFEIIKSALGLDFRDLTFANFEGVTVPEFLLSNFR
jgi:adenylate cyclase class 2